MVVDHFEGKGECTRIRGADEGHESSPAKKSKSAEIVSSVLVC